MKTNRPAAPRPPSSRGPSAARRSAEQRSAPLWYLSQLPRWLPPVVLAALLVAGLAVRGWAGAAALCVVAVLLGWLAYMSWPRVTGAGRLGRVAAISCLLGLALFQATR